MTTRVGLVGQQGGTLTARHVFRGVDAAWTGVDMSIQSTKDLTCTREHYCLFVVRHAGTSMAQHARQARHARHDERDALDTSCVSCRDVTQQVEFGLITDAAAALYTL